MTAVILSILVALLDVAVSGVLRVARRARIKLEIDRLAKALETYKGTAGAYPPDFGATDYTWQNLLLRNRIVSHWYRRFPLAQIPQAAGSKSDYQNLQAWVATLISVQNNYPVGWGDLGKLDQAEAMVFWLGGLPAIPLERGGGGPNFLHSRRMLLGWSASQQNPFDYQGPRLDAPFDFQDSRLADADGDGWYEYYPPVPDQLLAVPYLYFDSATYTAMSDLKAQPPFRPYTRTMNFSRNQPPAPVVNWDSMSPIASTLGRGSDPDAIVWANAEKYQIVSAGLDNQYGFSVTDAPVLLYVMAPPGNGRAAMFRIGVTSSTGGAPVPRALLDTLTNFSPDTLGNAQP